MEERDSKPFAGKLGRSTLTKVRILFVAGTLAKGGAEKQLFYTIRLCRELGYDVRVVSFDRSGFWKREIESMGVQVEVVDAKSRVLRSLALLIKTLRYRPTHVVPQHFFASPYCVLVSKLVRSTCFAAIRNDGLMEIRSLHPWIVKLTLSGTNVVLANTKSAIDNLANHGFSRPYVVLPNAIDLSDYSEPTPKLVSSFALVNVGRLVSQKRQDIFLNVVARLIAQGAPVNRVFIVGDGPLRSSLESKSKSLNVPLEFVGEIHNVGQWLRKADLLIHTSNAEGMPNVLMEGMAAGCPIVASAAGGVAELLEHKHSGFVCESEDQVVSAALSLMNDQKLYNDVRLRAWKRITAFSLDSHKNNLRKLFEHGST